MSHIFISYARKDIDFSQKIVTAMVVDLVSVARGRQPVRSAFEGRLT